MNLLRNSKDAYLFAWGVYRITINAATRQGKLSERDIDALCPHQPPAIKLIYNDEGRVCMAEIGVREDYRELLQAAYILADGDDGAALLKSAELLPTCFKSPTSPKRIIETIERDEDKEVRRIVREEIEATPIKVTMPRRKAVSEVEYATNGDITRVVRVEEDA